MPDAARPTSTESRRRRLLVLIVAAVLMGVAVVMLLVRKPWSAAPLDAELAVRITSPDGSKDDAAVDGDGSGALPVRAGERMTIGARLSQPAYYYLLWLDSQGRVVPLYPWNLEEIKIGDVNTPPAFHGPGKPVSVFSPNVIGRGWTFGKPGGLETVLLLARRTPLPPEVKLAELLTPLPPAPMRHREEAVSLRFDRGQAAPSAALARNRGDETAAREVDQPLLQRMEKLREHFDVVRAVRFAHEGE